MFEILFRVLFGFIILLALVRLMGNKQLGQLNVFTYISGIVIGSMVSDIILHIVNTLKKCPLAVTLFKCRERPYTNVALA